MGDRMKRWLRRGLLGLAVFMLVWWTGVPQEMAIEWAAETYGGVVIEVDGGHYLSGIGFDVLTVYPDRLAKSKHKKFAELRNIQIDLSSESDRRIPRVSIGELHLDLEESEEGVWNYQFVEDFLASAPPTTDMTWSPESVEIQSVFINGNSRDYVFQSEGVELTATLESPTQTRLMILGEKTAFRAENREANENDSPELDIEDLRTLVTIEIGDKTIKFDALLEDEGFIDAMVDARMVSGEHGTTITMDSGLFELEEEAWELVRTFLFPNEEVALHRLNLDLTSLSWNRELETYPTVEFTVEVDGLLVGDPEVPLYGGNIFAREFKVEGGESASFDGLIEIGTALPLKLSGELAEVEQRFNLKFTDWAKSDLVAQTPLDFRTEIDELAFDRLSGNIRLDLRDEAYTLNGTIQSTSTSGDSPVGLQVALEGSQSQIAGTTGTLALSLGEGKMTGSGRMTEAGDYEADVTLESMPLRPFALLAAGARLPEEVSGALDGTVSMRQAAESVDVLVTPAIVLSKVMVDEKSQPDLTLKSEIVVDTETRLARTDTFTISTDYDEVSLALSGAEYDLTTQKLTGDLAFGFDLGWVNRLADLGGISGTLKGSGTLLGVDQKWYLDYTATSDDIGYGDLLLPYGSEMTITGPLRVFEEDSEVKMSGTRITVDDGLEVMLHTARYEAGVLTGRADAKSDLSILVSMGYVEETSASVTGEANWAIEGDDREISWVAEGGIESLKLLENAGAVENTSFDAAGTYTDKLDGDGTIEVGVIHAAGATIFGTTGAIDFEDDKLVIKDASSTIFAGTLKSRVAVDLFGEGIPIRYDGDFTDVDLAQLTEEVKPPSTTMTGIASGDLEANYSIEKGLLGFELDAESNKGFTINRSLVEEMMQMQTVLKGLGEKKAEKTMAKFLGAEPQRPFESARITVFLFEEVIEGVAELKSPKTKDYNGLNLTIQLSIDQPALVQSLKMLEESSETEFGIQ